MRTFDEKELTDILTTLYDNRLKALIGHDNTDFTREIIEGMFRRFKEVLKETTNRGYGNYMDYISQIFSFMYNGDATGVSEAKNAVRFFVNTLENYQRCNLVKLLPDWYTQYPGVKFRNIFGLRFKELLWDYPERYPKSLRHEHMLSQLNYATFYRNHEAHMEEVLNTQLFSRYFVIYCYDVILTYLLYTFYYLALDENYTFKHLKEQEP